MRGHSVRIFAVLAVVLTWAVCENRAQAQVTVTIYANAGPSWNSKCNSLGCGITYSVDGQQQRRLRHGEHHNHTSNRPITISLHNGHAVRRYGPIPSSVTLYIRNVSGTLRLANSTGLWPVP
jgi:hypothetical protein